MYVCMYVAMYVCLSMNLTLTPIATLYDNGFSGRVQNSSRAFNYPCRALAQRRYDIRAPYVIIFTFHAHAPI